MATSQKPNSMIDRPRSPLLSPSLNSSIPTKWWFLLSGVEVYYYSRISDADPQSSYIYAKSKEEGSVYISRNRTASGSMSVRRVERRALAVICKLQIPTVRTRWGVLAWFETWNAMASYTLWLGQSSEQLLKHWTGVYLDGD